MRQWRLRPDVYAADVCGDLVFLDAASNHYSCLSRDDALGVSRAFNGIATPADADLIEEVAEAGLIEESNHTSQFAQPKSTATADYNDFAPVAPRPGFLAILSIALAAVQAAFALRFQRPKRWLARRRCATQVALTHVCALAATFERIRPIVPKSGRCLPKSMMMLAFLRRHGVDADWVFGVQTFPFEAHCWVEYQGVVLSDTLEHVRWYTPIVAR